MDLTELRKKILEHFGSEEFKTVCLDFKVANPSLTFDYDIHLAKSLNYEEIVQETIKWLSRESKLLDFVAFLKKERPDVDFNTFYSRLTSPTNPPINPIQTFLEKVKQDNEYLSPFRAIKMAEGFIPLYALQKMEAEKTTKESQEKQKSKSDTDETAGGGNSSTESEPQNNQQSDKNQPKIPPPTPPPIPLEAQKVALEHDQLLILGGSGMGKSTFLRYLAYQEASKPNGLIPIFAPLKEYTSGLLLQFCLHQAAPEDEALREMLNRQANDRKVWWLLDGLDEAHDKQKILDRAKGLPGKVTITSRPDDSYSFTSSKQFVLRPLNLQDIKQLLLQYFSADFSPADGEERVSKTIQNAQNNPAFRRLLESPLLLTFWADINRNTKVQNLSLPTQEVELYDSYLTRITQQEVTRHNSLPHHKDKQLDPDLMQKTFYGLGFILHNHKSNSPTSKEVEKSLLEYLKGLNVDNLLTAQQTIEFWLGTGLLRQALKGEPPQPFLALQHQSFQEYAVACFLHQAWQKDPNQTWQLLAPQHKNYPYATRLHHPTWQEPLRLLAQKMSSQELEKFINHLWQHPSPDEKYLHRDLLLVPTWLDNLPSINDFFLNPIIKRFKQMTYWQVFESYFDFLFGLIVIFVIWPSFGLSLYLFAQQIPLEKFLLLLIFIGILISITLLNFFIYGISTATQIWRYRGFWPNAKRKIWNFIQKTKNFYELNKALYISIILAFSKLGSVGGQEIIAVDEGIHSYNDDIKKVWMQALAKIGGEKEVAILGSILPFSNREWDSYHYRQWARDMLGEINSKEATVELIKAILKDCAILDDEWGTKTSPFHPHLSDISPLLILIESTIGHGEQYKLSQKGVSSNRDELLTSAIKQTLNKLGILESPREYYNDLDNITLVQRLAIQTLRKVGNAQAIPVLISTMLNPGIHDFYNDDYEPVEEALIQIGRLAPPKELAKYKEQLKEQLNKITDPYYKHRIHYVLFGWGEFSFLNMIVINDWENKYIPDKLRTDSRYLDNLSATIAYFGPRILSKIKMIFMIIESSNYMGGSAKFVRSKIFYKALVKIENEQAIDLLIQQMEKDVTAIIPLCEIGHPKAIPFIIERLNRNDFYIWTELITALGKLKEPLLLDFMYRTLRQKYADYFKQLKLLISEKETAGTTFSYEQSYIAVIKVLGSIGNLETVNLLGRIIKRDLFFHFKYINPNKYNDPRYENRMLIAIVEALGNIGRPEAVETLIYILQQNLSFQLNQATVNALGQIQNPKAIKLLATLFEHNITKINTHRGEDSIHPFLEAQKLLENIVCALGKINTSEAISTLIEFANEITTFPLEVRVFPDVKSALFVALLQSPDFYSDKNFSTLARKLHLNDKYKEIGEEILSRIQLGLVDI